jgi:hypothetical protein
MIAAGSLPASSRNGQAAYISCPSAAYVGGSDLSESKQKCFVLMPFGSPFDKYYEQIYVPAIQNVNLHPLRGDSLWRPSPIMNDVWRFVQESVVLVADLTGRNPNVFYELGLAHANGKPVVLVAETMEDVPFDLRGIRVIDFDRSNPDWGVTLRMKIELSLKETLADVLGAVPSMFIRKGTPEATQPKESPLELQVRSLAEEITALRRESTTNTVVKPLEKTPDTVTVGEVQVEFFVMTPSQHVIATIQRALSAALSTEIEVVELALNKRGFVPEDGSGVKRTAFEAVRDYIASQDQVHTVKALVF